MLVSNLRKTLQILKNTSKQYQVSYTKLLKKEKKHQIRKKKSPSQRRKWPLLGPEVSTQALAGERRRGSGGKEPATVRGGWGRKT